MDNLEQQVLANDLRVKRVAVALGAVLPPDYLSKLTRWKVRGDTMSEIIASTAMYYPAVYQFMRYLMEAYDLDKLSHLLWEIPKASDQGE